MIRDQRFGYIRQFWTLTDGLLVNRDDENIHYMPPNDRIWNLPARIGHIETNEGRVSVQGVKSIGSHFACLCRGFEFYAAKKKFVTIFQKENGNSFTLLY